MTALPVGTLLYFDEHQKCLSCFLSTDLYFTECDGFFEVSIDALEQLV